MQRGSTLCFAIALFFSATLVSAADSAKSLLRLDGLTRAQIQTLANQGYDIAKVGKTFVELVADRSETTTLTSSGTKGKVLIPDLDAYVRRVLSQQRTGAAYFTYDTMTARLQEWAKKYESIARMVSLGKSIEGRDIWAMKVSDNPDRDEKEPAALIMGATHAREWIAFEVPLEALKQILEGYDTDERLTRLVNEREIWFVPMVNPDGVHYAQTKSRYWRKNRRNVDGRSFGVDLNRNFGWHWGNTGASSNPGADTYHGTGAFSEPECAAIKTLADKEHFQGSISFHSYSELILYPFGYGYNIPTPDEPTLSKLAREMSKFNKYTPQNSADLYPAMGDSDDWLYGTHKTLAFTFELATDFIPPPGEIAEINQINVPAVFHLIEKCGTYGLTTPTGDVELARSLDLRGARDAWTDGHSLLPSVTVDQDRISVDHRLERVGARIADLVVADLLAGHTDSWDDLSRLPQGDVLKGLVRARISFERLHGSSSNPQ